MAGFYVMIQFLSIFLDVMLIFMLMRAVMSWFTMGGEGGGKLSQFVYVATEPFILPLRSLCARFGWFQGLPLDMPYLITTMLLGFANILLSGMLP